MRLTLALLFCGLLGLVTAAPTAPALPMQYAFTGTILLPYANITMPVDVTFDGASNQLRIGYYDNTDVFVYSVPAGMMYNVGPEDDFLVCQNASFGGPVINTIPDVTEWTWAGTQMINGVSADQWQLIVKNGTKVNTYNYYVAENGTRPVQFAMTPAHDNVFGSHIDMYIINYATYTTTINASLFEAPELCGAAKRAPRALLAAPLREMGVNYPDYVDVHFNHFIKTHGKSYTGRAEREARKEIFTNNLRYVDAHNSKKASYTMAINHFADLTHEELRLMRPGRPENTREPPASTPMQAASSDLPEYVDWRDLGAVSNVKDQAFCGSCWAFSTVGALEGQHFLKTGDLVEFSEQNLVDCSWAFNNTGCGGGLQYLAYEYLLSIGGQVALEADYAYKGQNGYCNKDAPTGAQIVNYTMIESGSEAALQVASATVGPIAVSIDAGEPSILFYSEGIYYEPACGNTVDDLDHSVLVVGYGNYGQGPDEEFWIVKNSWSTYWGDFGYIMMARNRDNNCGIATQASYPWVSDSSA